MVPAPNSNIDTFLMPEILIKGTKASTPGRSGETVDLIVQRIKNDIFSGQFAPGQRLISRDLVEQLGVSRGPLREAFRQLAAERLVDVIPNRGAIVRRLNATDVRNIYQIREALEGYAAGQAAARIHLGDNRAALEAVTERGGRHGQHPRFEKFIDDNRDFHQTLVSISGNPQLGELIDQYQLPVFMIQLRQAIGSEQIIKNSLEEHQKIADAVLNGDVPKAYRSMVAHLRHTCDLILGLPSLNEKRSV